MYLWEQESIFIQFYIRRSANYAHANISELSKAFDMIQRTMVGRWPNNGLWLGFLVFSLCRRVAKSNKWKKVTTLRRKIR